MSKKPVAAAPLTAERVETLRVMAQRSKEAALADPGDRDAAGDARRARVAYEKALAEWEGREGK